MYNIFLKIQLFLIFLLDKKSYYPIKHRYDLIFDNQRYLTNDNNKLTIYNYSELKDNITVLIEDYLFTKYNNNISGNLNIARYNNIDRRIEIHRPKIDTKEIEFNINENVNYKYAEIYNSVKSHIDELFYLNQDIIFYHMIRVEFKPTYSSSKDIICVSIIYSICECVEYYTDVDKCVNYHSPYSNGLYGMMHPYGMIQQFGNMKKKY